MVLPASPADPGVPGELIAWIAALRGALRLRRPPAQVLVLEGADAWLPSLLRAFHVDGFAAHVYLDATALLAAPPGSVAVYIPRLDELAALNEQRARLIGQRIHLVFWCDRATARALRSLAPDLHDLVARVFQGTPRIAPHAIAGLRAAACAGAAAVLWCGASSPAEALAEALPGSRYDVGMAHASYESVVDAARGPRDRWIVWRGAHDDASRRRLRHALAEAGRAHRNLVESPRDADEPGWWTVRDSVMTVPQAARALVGVRDAPTLATLCGMEFEAIQLAARLLGAGFDEDALCDALRTAADPGVTLARMARARSIVDDDEVLGTDASPPVRRALARSLRAMSRRRASEVAARREGRDVDPIALRGWAARASSRRTVEALRDPRLRAVMMEPVLRADVRPWTALAMAALLTGAEDRASPWWRAAQRAGAPATDEREVVRAMLAEWSMIVATDRLSPRTADVPRSVAVEIARSLGVTERLLGSSIEAPPTAPPATEPVAVRTPWSIDLDASRGIARVLGLESVTLSDMVRDIAAGLRARGRDAEAREVEFLGRDDREEPPAGSPEGRR
jgi:hypothetical protein